MDVVCQAKSGMGKTAVFVLATLQQLEPVNGQVLALLCLIIGVLMLPVISRAELQVEDLFLSVVL